MASEHGLSAGRGIGSGSAKQSREPNPIWQREYRARWRRPLTHLIVLSYTALLAWMAWQLYVAFNDESQSITARAVQTSPGANLFINATWLQTAVWAFLAPLLAAPAIAIETERGRLPELLIAHMSHREIVIGKLQSTLSFAGILLLVPLPITALCFQVGGVSPQDFILAWTMQAAFATALASLGLACSANNTKVAGAITTCLFMAVGSAVFILLLYSLFHAAFTTVASAIICGSVLLVVYGITAATAALEPINNTYYRRPGPRQLVAEGAIPAYLISMSEPTPAIAPSAQGTLRPEEANPKPARQTPHGPAKPSKLSPAQRAAAFNPLCERDLRSRLRKSSASALATVSTDDFVFYVTWIVPLGMLVLVFPVTFGIVVALVYIVTYCAAISASAFTSERGQGVLQMLLLTSLTPRDIVLGKVAVPLLLLLHQHWFALALLLAWSSWYGPLAGLATLLLVASFACCASAMGIGFSWVCRHASIAAVGTLITMVALVAGPRALYGMDFSNRAAPYVWWWTERVWNNLANFEEPGKYLFACTILSGVLLTTGVVVLLIVQRALRPGALETEKKSFLQFDLSQTRG